MCAHGLRTHVCAWVQTTCLCMTFQHTSMHGLPTHLYVCLAGTCLCTVYKHNSYVWLPNTFERMVCNHISAHGWKTITHVNVLENTSMPGLQISLKEKPADTIKFHSHVWPANASRCMAYRHMSSHVYIIARRHMSSWHMCVIIDP